jgi:hypothetical protein
MHICHKTKGQLGLDSSRWLLLLYIKYKVHRAHAQTTRVLPAHNCNEVIMKQAQSGLQMLLSGWNTRHTTASVLHPNTSSALPYRAPPTKALWHGALRQPKQVQDIIRPIKNIAQYIMHATYKLHVLKQHDHSQETHKQNPTTYSDLHPCRHPLHT